MKPVIEQQDAIKAAETLQFYLEQFEDDPLKYQLSGNVMISIRLANIKNTLNKMKKRYKRQLKQLYL